MPVTRGGKIWTIVIIILLLAVITGGVTLWLRFPHSRPIEITLNPPPEFTGRVYIDGAVVSPGYYSLKPGDTIDTLLRAAGGVDSSADLNDVTLRVSSLNGNSDPQKININRAESWLLEALPGIGEVLAGRIIDYRRQNGLFQNINELTRVEGVTTSVYEKIKSLITVTE